MRHLRALAGARFAADRWHTSEAGAGLESMAKISVYLDSLVYLDGLPKQAWGVCVAQGECSRPGQHPSYGRQVGHARCLQLAVALRCQCPVARWAVLVWGFTRLWVAGLEVLDRLRTCF